MFICVRGSARVALNRLVLRKCWDPVHRVVGVLGEGVGLDAIRRYLLGCLDLVSVTPRRGRELASQALSCGSDYRQLVGQPPTRSDGANS